jgi:hypothetical protein
MSCEALGKRLRDLEQTGGGSGSGLPSNSQYALNEVQVEPDGEFTIDPEASYTIIEVGGLAKQVFSQLVTVLASGELVISSNSEVEVLP